MCHFCKASKVAMPAISAAAARLDMACWTRRPSETLAWREA